MYPVFLLQFYQLGFCSFALLEGLKHGNYIIGCELTHPTSSLEPTPIIIVGSTMEVVARPTSFPFMSILASMFIGWRALHDPKPSIGQIQKDINLWIKVTVFINNDMIKKMMVMVLTDFLLFLLLLF